MTVEPQEFDAINAVAGPHGTAADRGDPPQVNGLVQRLFTEGSSQGRAGALPDRSGAFRGRAEQRPGGFGAVRGQPVFAQGARRAPIKDLLADKAVSQQDHDDAEAARRQAEAEIASWKAQVETARINLGYTRVTRPSPGASASPA